MKLQQLSWGMVLSLMIVLAGCGVPEEPQHDQLETLAPTWQSLGSAGKGYNVSLAQSTSIPNMNPLIAYSEPNSSGSGYPIRVKYLDNFTLRWLNVGNVLSGSSTAGSNAYSPSLAIDTSGRPVVAWYEDGDIYVKRFEGNSWVSLGGVDSINTGSRIAASPTLAIGTSNNLVVAYGWNQVLRGFDGNTWADLASVSLGGFSSGAPSLALDSAGHPVVAWAKDTELYIKRFDGSSWINVGTGVLDADTSPDSHTFKPSLALDRKNNPVLAWQEKDKTDQSNIYVQRFNGSRWENVGTGILNAARGDAEHPSLALDSKDNPVIAWHEYDGTSKNIYIKTFNGATWMNLGGVTTLDMSLANNASSPSLSIANGKLSVAWHEGAAGAAASIYVKQLLE